MDTVTLPAGFTARAPRLTDAETIFELVTAYNTEIVGFADYTLDDVRDELVEPGFDPSTDAWLVFDPADRLIGYGWSCRVPGSEIVDVDTVATNPVVAQWLHDRTLERAEALGREGGFSQITVDQGIYRANAPMCELAEAGGFAPATTYHRMRIEHTAPVPAPDPPSGAVLRSAAQDEEVRRTAHRVEMESFGDHFGHVQRTYDDWVKAHEAKSTFDWDQLDVLELDGTAVAICERTNEFFEDENCGYVYKLGVLSSARGRGLAKYLLRRAFALDAAAGRSGTILHVDTNNTSPALGLYESVGMRPYLVIDVWRQVLALT